MSVIAACVGCPGPPPAEPWQLLGLLAVAMVLTLAFGAALLALDHLNR